MDIILQICKVFPLTTRQSDTMLGAIKSNDSMFGQRDQFYKKELNDRDRHIEELKQALDVDILYYYR
jgi:hypothetical protein